MQRDPLSRVHDRQMFLVFYSFDFAFPLSAPFIFTKLWCALIEVCCRGKYEFWLGLTNRG